MYKLILIITIILMISITTASSEEVLKLSFEYETICIDDSTYENHGTYNDNTFDLGITGNAVNSYSGTSLITIPQSNELSFSDGIDDTSFTISFWINPETLPSDCMFISKGSGSRPWEYAVYCYSSYDNKVSILLYDTVTTGHIYFRTNQSLYDLMDDYSYNGWTNIVITYNTDLSPSNATFYINSVKVPSYGGITGTYNTMGITATDLFISPNTGYPNWYNGLMDDVILYNESLTQLEISDIYDSYIKNLFTITFMDNDLFTGEKNISVYEDSRFIEIIQYGIPVNVSNLDNFSFVLHEDSLDKFSNIENIADVSTGGISYLVYAIMIIGVIALLMYMFRRF